MFASRFDVITLGFRTRSFDDFLELLREHRVQYLVDVRSQPNDKDQAVYGKRELSDGLAAAGIGYLYMGRELGGQPEETEFYRDGRLDVAALRASELFLSGLQRLKNGIDQDLRLALVSAKIRPEQSHRFFLIGEALSEDEYRVGHLDAEAELIDHQFLKSELGDVDITMLGHDLASEGS